MKKAIIRYLLILFSLIIYKSSIAQEDQTVYFIQYSTIFKEHKAILTEDGKATIDSICQKIIHAGIDSFFSRKEVVLQCYTTAAERKKNRLIGMARCMTMLDYIEHTYKIPRVKFLIRDRISSPNVKPEVVFSFFRKLS